MIFIKESGGGKKKLFLSNDCKRKREFSSNDCGKDELLFLSKDHENTQLLSKNCMRNIFVERSQKRCYIRQKMAEKKVIFINRYFKMCGFCQKNRRKNSNFVQMIAKKAQTSSKSRKKGTNIVKRPQILFKGWGEG